MLEYVGASLVIVKHLSLGNLTDDEDLFPYIMQSF